MKIFDYEDRQNIGWNYYPDTDLMAYSLCGMQRIHGNIHNEVVDKRGEQSGKTASGSTLTRMTTSIVIQGKETNLTEKEKRKLFRSLREVIDAEDIQLRMGSQLSFYDDDYSLGYFLHEVEEFRGFGFRS